MQTEKTIKKLTTKINTSGQVAIFFKEKSRRYIGEYNVKYNYNRFNNLDWLQQMDPSTLSSAVVVGAILVSKTWKESIKF
jgi:hypothetical protein